MISDPEFHRLSLKDQHRLLKAQQKALNDPNFFKDLLTYLVGFFLLHPLTAYVIHIHLCNFILWGYPGDILTKQHLLTSVNWFQLFFSYILGIIFIFKILPKISSKFHK